MRKAIAILCLAIFFTLQYGKLVNYWQCKISAVIAVVQCDCEKLMTDAHNAGVGHAEATIVNEKTEEIYLVHELKYDCSPANANMTHRYPSYTSTLPEINSAPIFQPPRA